MLSQADGKYIIIKSGIASNTSRNCSQVTQHLLKSSTINSPKKYMHNPILYQFANNSFIYMSTSIFNQKVTVVICKLLALIVKRLEASYYRYVIIS